MIRIGILGGTFDPVHNGHIYLAEKVCKKLSLDKVIFIPAYLPPHKKGQKVTSARHRFNMLKLAIKGRKNFRLSDMEIKRKGRSYSVETLRRLRRKYGCKAELFFITGADSLKDLDKWKDLREILALCKFVVVKRPGFGASKVPEGFIFLDINAKDISATEIRGNINLNEPLGGLLPGPVKRYIQRYAVYAALSAVFFMVFLASQIAYSAQDDSAGAVMRSQEMLDNEKMLREKVDKNDKMLLRKAVIKGITLIDRRKTMEIFAPFKGHWISKDDIHLIIDSIFAAYKEKGYFEKIERIDYKISKNTLTIIVKEAGR